jgi:16S rRNA (guanine527-N7)-methyltransferase
MPPDFERDVQAALRRHRALLGPAADDGLIARLARFCTVLAETNQRINLTGIADPEGMAVRHVVDSLTLLPLLADAPSIMDLGSGGGVPGIPLAIALPAPQVTLVESRERKAAALDGMVRTLELFPRVRAEHARGEVWLAENAVHTVVARAVGETAELLERLRKGAGNMEQLILMKGPSVDEELAVVTPRLQRLGFRPPERHEAMLPGDAGRRVLLVFRRR